MKDQEYIILNKTSIMKRIEELEEEYKSEPAYQLNSCGDKLIHEIMILNEILSQSTLLIPEIEKLIVMASTSDIDFLPDRVEKIKQDYIAKLKT